MELLTHVCIIIMSNVPLGKVGCDYSARETGDEGCSGKKHYFTIDLDVDTTQPNNWSNSLAECQNKAVGGSLATVESASEREFFIGILNKYPGKTFWTQGALVAQYGDRTMVDTDFKADDYKFINDTKNPSWCLVLVKPVDSKSHFLRGADCEETNRHYPLCEAFDETCRDD